MSITPNAISAMYHGTTTEPPVVQIVNIKNIGATADSTADRYRLILSDGVHFTQGMMGTQLNSLVESKQMNNFCLAQINNHIVNNIGERKVTIILDMTIVGQHHEKIGTPINVEQAQQQQQHQPQQQQQQQQQPQYQQQQQQQYKPEPQFVQPNPPMHQQQNRGPVARVDPPSAVFPIEALNPYQNKWTIKARVTSKGDVRSWNKSSGSGTLFSCDLLDEKGGEIRCTFFKDACEKFYPMLQEQQVYYFSGGKLKVANKKFTSIKNYYEATFDINSIIIPCPDDGGIKNINFSFTPISDLETKEVGSDLDVIGVVKSAGECADLISKAGKPFKKRDLVLSDDSGGAGMEIKLTLWGDKASLPDDQFANSPVLAVKGVKVSEFGGRSLSSSFGAQIQFQPMELQDAIRLRQWFDSTGGSGARSLSTSGGGGGGGMGSFEDRMCFADIKDRGLGFGEKPDYVTVKGTIAMIKNERAWYNACPSDNCNKKVTQDVSGNWLCERCSRNFDKCQNRYILSFTAGDYSGNSWMTAFDDQARVLLNNVTADEAENMLQTNEAQYKALFTDATFGTYLFRLRVKAETVNEEQRVKCSVTSLQPLDYVQESKSLLAAIHAYN